MARGGGGKGGKYLVSGEEEERRRKMRKIFGEGKSDDGQMDRQIGKHDFLLVDSTESE